MTGPITKVVSAYQQRVDTGDWAAITTGLDDLGCALTSRLLSAADASELIGLYHSDEVFRSTVSMGRHRFGEGEYRYLADPLPDAVDELAPRPVRRARLPPPGGHQPHRARQGPPAASSSSSSNAPVPSPAAPPPPSRTSRDWSSPPGTGPCEHSPAGPLPGLTRRVPAALRRALHPRHPLPRRPLMTQPAKTYTLIGADAKPHLSAEKGMTGGHQGTKIFGRLDCPSALRAIARGGYFSHRVFFAGQATATRAGYRPWAVCMPGAHRAWKARQANARPATWRTDGNRDI
jgi:hypothetical protein